MFLTPRIAFVGFGNMAKALAIGAVNAGALSNDNIIVSSPSFSNGTKSTAFAVAKSNQDAVENADIIILGAKPDKVQTICSDIADTLFERQNKPLIVSIAAGVTIRAVQTYLCSETLPIVRVMPNTPVSVGLGASGFYANSSVTPAQIKLIKSIFESTGIVVRVDDEASLDKITAVSGSGPAYFLLMQEMLTASAVKLGLSRDMATKLVAQTMLGTGLLASKSELGFDELRKQVTSKGGTTAAALDCFIAGGLEKLVDDAVNAAYQRAMELSGTNE